DEPLGLEPLEQPLPLERRRADTERDGAEHGGAAEVSARLPGHGEAGPAEIDAEPGEQGTDASRTALTRREAVAQRSPLRACQAFGSTRLVLSLGARRRVIAADRCATAEQLVGEAAEPEHVVPRVERERRAPEQARRRER